MKNEPQTTDSTAIDESRRWFMGGAIGLGAVGVGLTAFGVQAAGRSAPEVAEDHPEQNDVGYHETDHIRRYYRSAG